MALVLRAMWRRVAANWGNSGRILSCGAVLALTALSFSSCTAMDVLSPEPRVAVGGQSNPQNSRGLQRLVPCNPMIVGYPRVDLSPRSPGTSMPASEV
jgi:hypothetical protein